MRIQGLFVKTKNVERFLVVLKRFSWKPMKRLFKIQFSFFSFFFFILSTHNKTIFPNAWSNWNTYFFPILNIFIIQLCKVYLLPSCELSILFFRLSPILEHLLVIARGLNNKRHLRLFCCSVSSGFAWLD